MFVINVIHQCIFLGDISIIKLFKVKTNINLNTAFGPVTIHQKNILLNV